MVEVDVADLIPRFSEFLQRARQGEDVVVTHKAGRLRLTPLDPPEDIERHLVELRARLRGPAPPPTAEELDADIAAMRGRG